MINVSKGSKRKRERRREANFPASLAERIARMLSHPAKANNLSPAYPPLRVKKYFPGTAGRPSTCKIISRRDSLEMGELCCLEFYVSARLSVVLFSLLRPDSPSGPTVSNFSDGIKRGRNVTGASYGAGTNDGVVTDLRMPLLVGC